MENPNEAPAPAVAQLPPIIQPAVREVQEELQQAQQLVNDPPTPWRRSRAKKILYNDIVTGMTNRYSGPTAVYFSRPIYQRYPKANFCRNYSALKTAIGNRFGSAAVAHAAVSHDMPIIQARRQGQLWRGSHAQLQLQRDVVQGRTEGKTPREVYYSRQLYRQNGMSLATFTSHLAHEQNRNNQQLQAAAFEARMRFINDRSAH